MIKGDHKIEQNFASFGIFLPWHKKQILTQKQSELSVYTLCKLIYSLFVYITAKGKFMQKDYQEH